jgi:hypothetical protein
MATELVTLQTICHDLKLDPRAARIRLRAAAKAKALPTAHAARGRWEWEPAQVAEVKKLLTAADGPVAASKPAKKAPAKKAAKK